MQSLKSNLTACPVLVAPLDWGLGHVTRCIPIIKQLKQRNCSVLIAASGAGASLLKKEFPNERFIDIVGYNIQYSKYKYGLAFKMLQQFFSIQRKIQQEHQWLGKIIEEYGIQAVISDNRFGLYSEKVPCVFITHQLQIAAPFSFLEKIIQTINYRYIDQFLSCWVPDNASENNIAGKLSHPKKKPKIPVSYIGPLVRFEQKKTLPIEFDICIMLSGPEPQRSILENILLQQLHSVNKTIVLIRGLPNAEEPLVTSENVAVYNHLAEEDLLTTLLQSELIVCRSGYTTVMELLYLQKKMILIPTPGQTEQEYLAKHLRDQRFCICFDQQEFSLINAVAQAKKFDYAILEEIENNLEKTVTDFLSQIA